MLGSCTRVFTVLSLALFCFVLFLLLLFFFKYNERNVQLEIEGDE